MNDAPVTSPFSLARFGGTLVAVTVLGAGMASAACAALGFGPQIAVLNLTAAACLAASLVALLPIHLRAAASASGLVEGFMVGILLRMVLTGAAVVVLDTATDLPTASLGLWAAAWYLLLLGVEVKMLAGLEKKGAAA